jgi:hypothetical protein
MENQTLGPRTNPGQKAEIAFDNNLGDIAQDKLPDEGEKEAAEGRTMCTIAFANSLWSLVVIVARTSTRN